MRNQTDMMREILTNATAQRIIRFVSPIYGNSYVGLWLYQAIGEVVGEVSGIADQLRYETHPATAELLLDYWEDHYKIPRDSNMTAEQRRQRILSKLQSKGACTPFRLESAISAAIGGVPVEVEENVSKNTFRVNIHGSTDDVTPAVQTVNRMKPAHLIYWMQMLIDAETDFKVASAITHAETHEYEVACIFYETVDTGLAPAAAFTHAENYTMEVLN